MKPKQTVDVLLGLFKDEYKQPLKFTPTQKKIIYAIALKEHDRVGVIAPTQYGKSTAIAIGIIIRCMLTPEKFIIVGGTKQKAAIIMGCIIDHLFDDLIISSQIQIEGGTIEKLQRERRRDHITFKRGGEVKIISAENRNSKRVGEQLLGEGAKNVVVDDSVLVDDGTYSYVKRLVGGHKINFILEAANPLKRNHFYRTMVQDKLYYKIWIDCKVALKEGRFTKDYLAEMRKERFYDVFYECKFPHSDAMDDAGYMLLLSEDDVDGAIAPVEVNLKAKGVKLGVDVAMGGDRTVFALREGQKLQIDKSIKTPNLMEVPGLVIEYMREPFNIPAGFIFIDGSGLGAGVSSRLIEQHYAINNITWGCAASDESKGHAKDTGLPPFLNMRAECYWLFREYIQHGGKIAYNENLISQLKEIKYRVNSSGVIQVQPKKEMVLSGCNSPDEADAAAETFAPTGLFTVESSVVETNSAFDDIGIKASDLDKFNMNNF